MESTGWNSHEQMLPDTNQGYKQIVALTTSGALLVYKINAFLRMWHESDSAARHIVRWTYVPNL